MMLIIIIIINISILRTLLWTWLLTSIF